MLGLLAPSLVAIIGALALGGSFRSLLEHRIRAWPAVAGAFAVELVIYNPPFDRQPLALSIGPWIWLASRSVLLAVLLANARPARRSGAPRWPWVVAALGVGLNSLVIAGNGGHMPQSAAAAAAVWGASHIQPGTLQNVAPIGQETWLPWLADVIPEPGWLPRPNVVSPGDVLLACGIACWVFTCLRPGNGPSSGRIVSGIPAPVHGAEQATRRWSR